MAGVTGLAEKEIPPGIDLFLGRLGPGGDARGIPGIARLVVEEMRREIESVLRVKCEVGHAPVAAEVGDVGEKMLEFEEAGLGCQVRKGNYPFGDGVDRPVRPAVVGSRRMARDTSHFVIEGTAAFRVGMAGRLQPGRLAEGTKKGHQGLGLQLGEIMSHLGHRRSRPGSLGIAQKGDDPVALHPRGESVEGRAAPFDPHGRLSMAVGATQLGIEQRTATGRDFFGMEPLVARHQRFRLEFAQDTEAAERDEKANHILVRQSVRYSRE